MKGGEVTSGTYDFDAREYSKKRHRFKRHYIYIDICDKIIKDLIGQYILAQIDIIAR